jgi:hypothetical protein
MTDPISLTFPYCGKQVELDIDESGGNRQTFVRAIERIQRMAFAAVNAQQRQQVMNRTALFTFSFLTIISIAAPARESGPLYRDYGSKPQMVRSLRV